MSAIGDKFRDWLDGGKESSENPVTSPHDDTIKRSP